MYMGRKLRGGMYGSPFHKHNHTGFSLLEIIMVVAITGLLVFAMLPAVSEIIANVCLRHLVVILARDIRYVQQQNMQEPSRGWKLELRRIVDDAYIEQHAWAVSRLDNNMRVTQFTRKLPDGISFLGADTFTHHEISFTETGTPVNAGTVWLQNKHARYAVSVMVFSGRIRWRKE